MNKNYPEYRYRELLTVIGNDRTIQEVLRNYGYDVPSTRVIEGWRSRNSVPPRWLPLLMEYAMTNNMLRGPEALLKTPV